MELNFTKMVPVKSYEHVVDQIQSAICDGKLKEGDKLPSELKLKDMFRTSRGTVREALRILEQKGLVSIKTGVKGGATVKEANTDAMSDSMALLIRHQKVSLLHLAEFREYLEGLAAEKAAMRANKQQIEELLELSNRIQKHVDSKPDGWNEFHELDAQFHRKLAELADNPLILANLVTVHENIHGYFHRFLPFSQELLEEDCSDLCAIADAIGKRDALQAGAIARKHISKFAHIMQENQDKQPSEYQF